jgi:transcriptional regulator with XRE-family HTH domain
MANNTARSTAEKTAKSRAKSALKTRNVARARTSGPALMAAVTPDRDAKIVRALELLRAGKSVNEVAQELGVDKSRISRWLTDRGAAEYEAARHFGITTRLHDIAEQIEEAPNHLVVARLREVLKFWQWIAERRLRDFAPKQEISGPGGGPITIEDNLERARRLAFLQAQVEREPPPIDAELVEDDPQDASP